MCCYLSRPLFSRKIFSRSQIVSPGGSMNTSRSISSPIFLPALSQELALPSFLCQDMVLGYIFYLNLHISPSMLLIHCLTHYLGSILVSPILHNPIHFPHCREENLELCFQNFFLIRYCARWKFSHDALPPSIISQQDSKCLSMVYDVFLFDLFIVLRLCFFQQTFAFCNPTISKWLLFSRVYHNCLELSLSTHYPIS